jgi:hypothetical protein
MPSPSRTPNSKNCDKNVRVSHLQLLSLASRSLRSTFTLSIANLEEIVIQVLSYFSNAFSDYQGYINLNITIIQKLKLMC